MSAINLSADAASVPLIPHSNTNTATSTCSLETRSKVRASLSSRRSRRMTRRGNLIAICGVSVFCILLLIATTQHRTLQPASAINGYGNDGGLSNNLAHMQQLQTLHSYQPAAGSSLLQQQQQQQQQSVIAYNLTASIEDVLAAQRARILYEMENFEYPRGGAEKLSELTLESNGTPVRSIIVTSWRSGSTFLGDILNSIPGNYYHYEPLLDFGIQQVRGKKEEKLAIENLKNLLNCNYAAMTDYLEYGQTHTYLFEHNERLWNVCKEFPHYCWRPKFLTPFCRLFPMQSMKAVRLRLRSAEKLLLDESLNVRIVLLVRDPRGTMQSRRHRVWCGGNPDCDDANILCEDLIDDYKVAKYLLKRYPSRFRTLRYEDLSVNPVDITQEILQFYGLPFDPKVDEFLETHTKINLGGVSSTYRDSRSAPFHWRTDLKIEEIKHIQDVCSKAMEMWGYRKIDNFTTDFQSKFDPIIMPPPFT